MEQSMPAGASRSPDAPSQADTPYTQHNSVLAEGFARIERLAKAALGAECAAILLTGAAPADGIPSAEFRAEAPLLDRAGIVVGVLRVQARAARPPLDAREAALLGDLAAAAMDALALERERARLVLRDQLLGIVAEAASFTVAIEMAMAAIRDATHCMLCLFFRLAPDGEQMQLVAGQASSPALTEAFVEHLSRASVRRDNSLVGLVAASGVQQVISGIDDSALRRFPAISLSVAQRIVSQIVTPISLGSERYAFSVGFGTVPTDQDEMAETLLGLADTLRPLLRRLRDFEQTELFRRALEASEDAVIISEVGAAGPVEPRIRYVNDAFIRNTGYAREAVLGRPHALLQGKAVDQELADSIAAGTTLRRDVLNHRADGSEFWADSATVPLADVTGTRTHWVAIERDITQRKQAEDAVALNEQRFRLVARAVTDVVWDWDLATGAIWWNEGLEAQFGYAPCDVAPTLQWWTERIVDDDRARVLQGLRETIGGARPSWSDEYRLRKADGGLALVSDRAFVLQGTAGRAVRMIGCMVDITRQRQLEDQLRQSQRLDALGRLTGGVAHDFNNLLAVIIGNADMLAALLRDDDRLREPIGLILGAAERGADLARRLLTFARQQPLDPRPADISLVLGGVEEMVRRLIGSHIDVTFTSLAEPAHVLIDQQQLENAILNLCINARDAMPDGGRLQVTAGVLPRDAAARPQGAPDGDCVTITVADTGHGMSREVLSRAFEPFFTTKSFGQGSGLGLSMVFGFVSQSRGHVEIGSEPDIGTQVTLYLPRTQAEPVVPVPVEPAAPPTVEGAVVLLVEDDQALRDVVMAQLSWLGYRVLAAGGGRQALEMLRAHADVALLFTDVVMPGGMSGQQLAAQARVMRPELPVLFTSGFPGNALADGGLMPLLAKPYRLADLAASVRRTLAPPVETPS
jgi:PAS domain S-box-containing protein